MERTSPSRSEEVAVRRQEVIMGVSLFEINRLEMKDGVFTFSDQPN